MRASRLTLLPTIALCLVSTSALAATVYKWVDANGVTHYSDQPNPQATAVEVQGAQSYGSSNSSAATTSAPTSSPAADAPPEPAYSECVLYQPENDEVFQNTSVVSASIRISPDLQPGHRIAVALDGRRQENVVATPTEFTLRDVERGTHTLFFAVEDRQANQLCRSSVVTFHVRQPSLLSPLRRGGR